MLNDVNYVYGEQDVLIPAHLSFGKFVLSHFCKFKDRIAMVNTITKEELTYNDFTKQVVNVSMLLKNEGVKVGDIVGVGSESRNEILPTAVAIIAAGAAFTPLEIHLKTAGLLQKLSVTKPKYFICSASFWNSHGTLLRAQDFIKTIICFDDTPDIAISIKSLRSEKVPVDCFEPVDVKGQVDAAMVLYSSGSSGLPKGVVLSHLFCIFHMLPEKMFSDESTVWFYGEWCHSYDIFYTFQHLTAGKKIVYSGYHTLERIVQDIIEFKVNIAFMAPFTLMDLTNVRMEERHKMDSLKVVFSAGAPLKIETVELLKSQYPALATIIQQYGMTEVHQLTSEKWATKGSKPGSVGKASPGTTFKVTDLNTGQPLGPNRTGEICMKGPGLMKGYMGVDPNTYLDSQGFLKTGDLGYYDEDGYFFIVDRIKEIMTVFSAFKVSPAELEALIIQHPGVKEAAVVGKADSELGDLPTAFVVKQPNSNVTEKELTDLVAAQAMDRERLTGGVHFVSVLPRNFMGKVLRKELRESLKELRTDQVLSL